jgi:hypothetical protein
VIDSFDTGDQILDEMTNGLFTGQFAFCPQAEKFFDRILGHGFIAPFMDKNGE